MQTTAFASVSGIGSIAQLLSVPRLQEQAGSSGLQLP